MLPNRKQAETYYSHFRGSNITLNRRFQITDHPSLFGEDFSSYPEHRTDLWDENRANEAIKRILTLYSELADATKLEDATDLSTRHSTRYKFNKSLAKLKQNPRKYLLDKLGSR
ncbi:hypothetical protein GCM10007094_43830 [Pseudovibrio japonicus]|uniref:Uncharacterized protein n=2 Tax=Pseudovibrio japonicus TaxID=366534 RepID=A0ABQ3EX90_9HYPH|nr:hypothetical protein GCM10007094_43830 [Pseudovibrio japonicus]